MASSSVTSAMKRSLAAMWAHRDVDFEYAFEPLRPRKGSRRPQVIRLRRLGARGDPSCLFGLLTLLADSAFA